MLCQECGEEIDDDGFCLFCQHRIESYQVITTGKNGGDKYKEYLRELPKVKWEMAILAMGLSLFQLKRGLPAP